MEAVVHCGKFATKGSRPFGRLPTSGCDGLRDAEDKKFVRRAALLRWAVFEISSVPPTERAIDC
jgi:hypothetical protein